MKQFQIFLTVFLFAFISSIFNLNGQDYYPWLVTNLESQGVTGGIYSIGGVTESATLAALSGSASKTSKTVTGQNFTKSVEVNVASKPANVWDSNFQLRNNTPLKKGDIVLAAFFMRCTFAADATGACEAQICFKENSKNEWLWGKMIKANTSWRQYYIPFIIDRDYAKGNFRMEFFFGFKVQKVEIAGFSLINFGTKYNIGQIPITIEIVDYKGREANASWRAEAEKRINQLRKDSMRIAIVDKLGNPIPNAKVEVRMKRHEFLFGTAVEAGIISNNDASAQRYRSEFLKLFNFAVIGNNLKWGSWEWADTRPATIKTLQFFKENNIPYRGHNMIWPRYEVSSKSIQAEMDKNPVDTLKVLKLCMDHIDSIVDFTKPYQPTEWDVVNETSMEHFTRFMAYEHYADFYKKAREACPAGTKLYINEACPEEYYFKYMDMMIKQGAPVDGIGIQGHYNYELGSNPEGILAQLDSLYKTYQREILISEFDYTVANDIDFCQPALDSLAADFTRDLLTVCFSHPSMHSFMMWGFWNGDHWLKNAPIYRTDWSLRPSGKAYKDLVLNKWFTNFTDTADTYGKLAFNGFRGDYDIVVTNNGFTKIVNSKLVKQGTDVTIQFDSVPSQHAPVLYEKTKSPSSIKLSWNRNNEIDYYQIYLNDTLLTTDIHDTTYEAIALKFSTSYNFKIRGIDKQGYISDFSNTVTAKTTQEYYQYLSEKLKADPYNFKNLVYVIGGKEETEFSSARSFTVGQWNTMVVNDTIFNISQKVIVNQKPVNFWDILLQIRNQEPVYKGDKLTVILFVRSLNGAANCKAYLSIKSVDANTELFGGDLIAGSAWKQIVIKGIANSNYNVEKIKMEIFAGYQVQSFELGGIAMVKEYSEPSTIQTIGGIQKFLLYPNPVVAGQSVQLKFSQYSKIEKLVITDLSGKIVASTLITGSQMSYTIPKSLKGFYLISVISHNAIQYTKLFVN